MTFITVNADEFDSELSKKSLEQQRLELEQFEEMKSSYNTAVKYIKETEIASASNVLLNLYENELFSFKSFDAKQLQKSVLKLLLSLKTVSVERQLSISLKGLELFSEEKYFWENCGDLLIESGKFDEAVEIYAYLFKMDPYSSNYLKKYTDSLKSAFKFDELENLKQSLLALNWLSDDHFKMFDWKSEYPDLLQNNLNFESDRPKTLEVLNVPIKDLNWANYASILHSMASGNFVKVFKKQPFNPDNYSLLSGPCFFEINCNSSANSQGNTQQNTQSILLQSLHEQSASSMDDLSKKRSSRRKEPRLTQSLTSKAELNAADFIRNIRPFFDFDEEKLVQTLCSTERACLQLIDKNNSIATETDDSSMDTSCNQFTQDALQKRITIDNESKKPLALRIFEFIDLFFRQSLKSSFSNSPYKLPSPSLDLWNLFKKKTFSLENLADFIGDRVEFIETLISVCECHISSKVQKNVFSTELAILASNTHLLSDKSKFRYNLLTTFLKEPQDLQFASLKELAEAMPNQSISTRYHSILPSIISSGAIQAAIEHMQKSKTIDEAERLCCIERNPEAAKKLFDSESSFLDHLAFTSGELKLRLCKLYSSMYDSFVESAMSELLGCYRDLDFDSFIDYLTVFISNPKVSLLDEEKLVLLCVFWNIFSKKSNLQSNSLSALHTAFAMFIEFFLDALPLKIESARFFLSWMAQEKCFGAADGLVPLFIFKRVSESAANNLNEMKFCYSVAFSLLRFPNIFTNFDSELGFEEWDRAPIGPGPRDATCPNLCEAEFHALTRLIHQLDEIVENETEASSKLIISDPGFVSFVDWLKKHFSELSSANSGKQFFYVIELNRNHLRAFFNATLQNHVQKHVLHPPKGHFHLEDTESLRYLLNARSDLVYSELQGRKKSFEILKTIRSDLKFSLSLDVSEAEIWKLLGICYHDAAVHFMSSEAEFMTDNLGKLKRSVKKAILALMQSLKIDRSDREAWTKLMDLIDWSLHEPSMLFSTTDGDHLDTVKFLCSVGCSAAQNLLPEAVARDRWILFLRLELFLRRSGAICDDSTRQLELLKEASLASCAAYSENVYETTATYMSLVKFYSRILKLKLKGHLSDEDVVNWLQQIDYKLPVCLQSPLASSADQMLYDHFEALNTLDRKKIFHSHVTPLATIALKLLKDPNSAINQLQPLFPFLRAAHKKTNATSLLQIYQCEHERPARFLVAGKRYLLQLIDFLAEIESQDFDKKEILTQFLKKLHYIRRTILGFPEILLKATKLYLTLPEPDEAIVDELMGSLKAAFNGKIPIEIQNQSHNEK